MDQPIDETPLGKRLLEAFNNEQQEEYLSEVRLHLSKGKWFLKAAEILLEKNPIYYDKMKIWWLWNQQECVWEEKDETDIINLCRITLQLYGDTSIKHTSKLLEALRQKGREKNPKEPEKNLIQFGKEFININTQEILPSTPEYFSTNSIPWNIGSSNETPEIDKLITSWVGEEMISTIYEIIAYSTYRDYPIHRIFCFVGTGANGKTRLLKLIEKFIGKSNKASSTLKKIGENDFALFPLYRKLACFIGETAHHRLESTEILKALSGQDPVSFEAKGKNGFTDTNYAKLFIGTNVLPPSSDTSRGWYRRWLIIPFPNEFTEGEDVLNRIPDEEYQNLAAKCVTILPSLLQRGSFSSEGTIEQRQQRYVEQSNPIKTFIDENYERDPEQKIKYTECYLDYLKFLVSKKMRRVNKKEFSNALEDEGLESQRVHIRDTLAGIDSTTFFIIGLRKKSLDTMDTMDTHVPVGFPHTPSQPLYFQASKTSVSNVSNVSIYNQEVTNNINKNINDYNEVTNNTTKNTIPKETKVSSNDFLWKSLPDVDLPNCTFSRDDVLGAIRGLAELDGKVAISEVDRLFGNEPYLESYYSQLKANGDIFENPKGYFRVL